MSFHDYIAKQAEDDSVALGLRPMAELVERYEWVGVALESGADIVAEDAAEAAFCGDGPCGSAARATEYHKLEREARALRVALRSYGPPAPVVVAPLDPDEVPF